jgi:hypothetical protein
MTPAARFSTALSTLRWSYGDLAAELGVSSGTPRRWATDPRYPVPPDVLATLERWAEAHAAHPLPRKAGATASLPPELRLTAARPQRVP